MTNTTTPTMAIVRFSAGTMEPFRDDASRFPAAALGNPLAGYPDERWVDVRDATVRSNHGRPHREGGGCRLRWRSPERLAAFFASPGLAFTRAESARVVRPASPSTAHARGLSVGLVEGDESLSAGPGRRLRLDRGAELRRHRLSAGRAVRGRGQGRVPDSFSTATRAASPQYATESEDAGFVRVSSSGIPDLDAFRVGCP